MPDFTLVNPNEGCSAQIETEIRENGVTIVTLRLAFEKPAVPKPVSIKWEIPCKDIWSVYCPRDYYKRNIAPSWRPRVSASSLAQDAPIQQMLSIDGKNRQTVALSDAATPCEIRSGLVERTAMLAMEAVFFTYPVDPISSYTARVYINMGDVRYDEAIKAAERFWADECGYPSAYVPADATAAVYSSWYSFHKALDRKKLLKECRIAKKMGMDVVIVDDGWQCEGDAGGYAKVGDWKPYRRKFPDMKAFVDKVHETGMKCVLWYHLSGLGKQSEACEKFKNMVLNPESTGNTYILDPRYPEVRAYLCGIFAKAMQDWGLDGFKLDFIDSFKRSADTPEFSDGWDTLSLEAGIDKLLSDITGSLREINPDVLIEFRQFYYGPVIRKYGNMIRVGDCPNDSMRNHVSGTDLRLLLGKTPVHSDMLMWHKTDTLEAAATQVISTLFLVPQISVLLDEISSEHKKMLGFYLNFRNEHKTLLMNGCFSAENPEQNYSLVKSALDGETVAVAYSNRLIAYSGESTLWFINSSSEASLFIKDLPAGLEYRIYSPLGKIVSKGRTKKSAVRAFDVPRCGLIELTKK